MSDPATVRALSARLDRLNSAIERAERALLQINLCVKGEVKLYPMDPDTKEVLGYAKIGTAWRLYVDAKGQRQPLSNAPQEIRLVAAVRVDELLQVLLDKANARASEIEVATMKYQTFANQLLAEGK